MKMKPKPLEKITLTRKSFLKGLGAGALAAAFAPGLSFGQSFSGLTTRPIPKSGQQIPVVGLGTAYGFGASSGEADFRQRKEVINVLLENGGSFIDTSPSPSYGVAEEVIGQALKELGNRSRAFLATKISTFGKNSGERQYQASRRYLQTSEIDLLQVHNLKDTTQHLKTIREEKEKGNVRYIGVTHYLDSGLSGLARALKNEPLDFVQCHYSAFERAAEREILDLARDKGVALIANRPFARGSVFRATRGLTIPEWASEELGIQSWGQFFLKFTLSHPGVTVAIPGTDKPHHMLDNIGAAKGPFPDGAQRQKMIQFVEAL